MAEPGAILDFDDIPDESSLVYPYMSDAWVATVRQKKEQQREHERLKAADWDRRLRNWLSSIETAPDHEPTDLGRENAPDEVKEANDINARLSKRAQFSPTEDSDRRPSKRVRVSPEDDSDLCPSKRPRPQFSGPCDAMSPPLTDLPTDSMPATGTPTGTPASEAQKRTNEDMDTDQEAPRKRSKIVALDMLEKPLFVQPCPVDKTVARNILPRDIHGLFARLTSGSRGTVPFEVREDYRVQSLSSDVFRAPGGSDGSESSDGSDSAARRTLDSLSTILQDTHETVCMNRHEDSWNMYTHAPFLRLVFPSHALHMPYLYPRGAPPTPQANVRCESVMHAKISRESVPLIPDPWEVEPPRPACSVSGTTVTADSDTSASTSTTATTATTKHRRSSHKKVDFVLALDLAEDTPLRTVIRKLNRLDASQGLEPHVNQTIYPALTDSLIAVSVETKTKLPKKQAIDQLGIWAAAWHKRMYQLRQRLGIMRARTFVPTEAQAQSPVQSQAPARLVSMPLIQVVGHKWEIFFACDQESRIQVYGPISIGSTETLESMYLLLASLNAIKEWILTDFRASMEVWFGV